MTSDLRALTHALLQHEGYVELRMWEAAWNVLEDLPTAFKNEALVLFGRIDVLIGLEEWEKAHMLAESVAAILPHRAEAWLRLARLEARKGSLSSAKMFARKCIELDPEMRLQVLEDKLLTAIW